MVRRAMVSMSGRSISMRGSEERPPVNIVRLSAVLAAVAGAICAAPVSAQVQRSGGSPNAQIMQQYQQVVAERTHVQAENAKLKKDVDEPKKTLGTPQHQLTDAKQA